MKAQLGIGLLAVSVLASAPAWSQVGGIYLPPAGGSLGSSQSGQQDPGQAQDNSQITPSAVQPIGVPQDSSQQQSSSSDNSGPQPAYTHPEELPPLALLGEVASQTGLHMGFSMGAYHDSNGGFSAKPQPDTYFQLAPTIGITQLRPTLAWTFGYSGGLSLNTANTQTTYLSNTAAADILWQAAARWQVHVKDGYSYSNDPFTPYLTYSSDPTPNHPNPTIYVPEQVGESNRGLIDVTHVLGAHDSLTFTGTESYNRYLRTSFTGFNNFSYGGRAAYNHLFSAKFSAGGAYNYNILDFAHGQSRSGVSMIMGFVNYQINSNMSVSGWIGPEYTTTKDIVPQICFQGHCYGYTVSHSSAWSTAYGANFVWTGQRNAMRAAFSKQISDGGGLLGTVKLYYVTAGFTRKLSPRWDGIAGMSYGNNHSTSLFFSDRYVDSIVGSVTLKRHFTPAWEASVGYTYLHETQANIYPYPKWNDNRFGVRIQYLWGHSLGR